MPSPLDASEAPLPRHNILFTIPRTASHLLTHLLNLPSQPTLHRPVNDQDGYFFLGAAIQRFRHHLPGKPVAEWTTDEKSSLSSAFQQGFDQWTSLLSEADKANKTTYIKEHLNWLVDPYAEQEPLGHTDFQVRCDTQPAPSLVPETKSPDNITCLPDAFLLERTKPTFLIRHPALTFPSALRTAIDNEGRAAVLAAEKIQAWECTYRWSLPLYRFYASSPQFDRRSGVAGVEYPIVLDARDLGDEELVRRYAEAVGLESGGVRFGWEKAGEEVLGGMGRVERRMKSTLLGSSGVERDKLGVEDVELGKMRDAWKEEFGDVLGERLARLVDESMEAFKELRRSRLRA